MGFSKGEITLNSPNSVYYAGQVVSGNVSFTLEMPTTMNVITATFTGEALVEWQDTDGETCTNKEQYFNVTVPLCGGNGVFTLPSGRHQYAFQYQIPFEVPGTFSDDTGTVQYFIEAAAESPNVCRETIDVVFTVVTPLDLNKDDENKKPIDLEFDTEGSGCCFGSKPVLIQIKTPFSGFCPGQEIPIQVSVDNKSNVEVRRLLFELISVTTYRSQTPISELTTPPVVLERVKRGPILCKAEGDFVVDFPVPEMVAPNLDACDIIDIEYSLRVTVKLTGCSKDETGGATIGLGHIPLIGSQNNYEPPLKECLPAGPIPTKPLQTPMPQAVPCQPQNAGALQQNMPYPQVPPYSPPQGQNIAQYPMANNRPYANNVPPPQGPNIAQYPMANNPPLTNNVPPPQGPYMAQYPMANNPPYPLANAGQIRPMPPPQWNGGSYPQFGFTTVPPSAPSL